MCNRFDPQLSSFIPTHNPQNLDEFRKTLFTKCEFILSLISKYKRKPPPQSHFQQKKPFEGQREFRLDYRNKNFNFKRSYDYPENRFPSGNFHLRNNDNPIFRKKATAS